jgi:hypothetical protein
VNGHEPDRDPVKQAKACADRVCEILARTTGQRFKTRPVVLYPDWWVETQPKGVEVWVLNPKVLPAFVDEEPTVLNADEINRLSAVLEDHVRAALPHSS